MAGPKEKGTKIPKGLGKFVVSIHRGVYRLSGGRIGSSARGITIALLSTVGAKSGKKRTMPLTALEHKAGWAVIASFAGHDEHPGWYHNLIARPEATLQIGSTVHSVRARVLEGTERTEVWDRAVEVNDDYAKYQRVTDRIIPVVALEPS